MKKALFGQIYEDLLIKIKAGELAVGQMMPTELELAQQYSVSRITTKRALDELKQRGYIERKRGSGSYVTGRRDGLNASSMSNIVTLVIPFSELIDCAIELISGITTVFSENGLYLTIVNSHSKAQTEHKILERLIGDNMRGIILNPATNYANAELLLRYTLNKYPIITVDKCYDGLDIGCVTSDNADGGFKAGQHLYSLNHRRMTFVSDIEPGSFSTIRDRYLGFCKALMANGIEIDDDSYQYIGHIPMLFMSGNKYDTMNGDLENMDAWKVALSRVLDKNDPPTAIFAAYDYLGCCLMKAAQTLGVNVPKELSIIGFDNVGMGRYTDIPLSTVAQDFYALGAECAKMIISLMQTGDVPKKKVVLPVELIPRQSTSAI